MFSEFFYGSIFAYRVFYLLIFRRIEGHDPLIKASFLIQSLINNNNYTFCPVSIKKEGLPSVQKDFLKED